MRDKTYQLKRLFYLDVVMGHKAAGRNSILNLAVLLLIVSLIGCRFSKADLNTAEVDLQRRLINGKYPKILKDEILQQNGAAVYNELKERYRASLAQFKNATENDCTKLVVVIISPEVDKAASPSNNFGIPFILESCSSLNIDCIDLSAQISSNDISDLAMLQEDIAWTANGSAYIANLFTNIIFKYGNSANTKVFPDSMKKYISGDLPHNDNEVLGGAMNLPYRLRTNAQGFRMEGNISLPKTKQRILFLGNSVIYQPYLDNDNIMTTLLQKRFADKEIINAAVEHYTLEDELSLYTEKLKYAEPDLVILCTDGNDILSYFFTQRNHYSRLKKAYPPTNTEKSFYTSVITNGAAGN